MTYKTHVALALLPAVAVESYFNYLSFEVELIIYMFTSIGALAPDLDEEGSYLSKKIPIVPFILSLFGVVHRGITHRLIFVLGILIVGFILNGIYAFEGLTKLAIVSFAYGYLMHLMGDMLTKGGINKFFYPLSNARGVLLPRVLRFYTNSVTEKIWFTIILIFTASLFVIGL